MSKLLSANLARLWKDKVFWITMISVFLFSLINMWNSDRSAEAMTQSGFIVTLDDYYFNMAPYSGLVCAVFISLFLGTEYSDGTMRNKLTVGHTRNHVYLANFFTGFIACLFLIAAWFLGGLPGIFLIGPFEMGFLGFLVYLLITICFTATLSAIYTFVSTMSSNKALTIVFALLVWLGMALAASALNDHLSEPEMNGGMAYVDGAFKMLDPTPNPLYLTGGTRILCECLLDLLPVGQAILMMDAAIEHPVRQIVFSLLLAVIAVVGGFVAFRKKDIK